MTDLQQIASSICFAGQQLRFEHASEALNCSMRFSVYLPPGVERDARSRVPVLLWLSGLTCTDRNFVEKAGAQRFAAQHGIAIVAPDTSPRGDGVPDDAEGHWDMGLGAGFYVNATQSPWAAHYKMYDYVVKELPALLSNTLPLDCDRMAISGHSMGGHGALMIALRNPSMFRSVSAFAPICAPMDCPWGQKAFGGYLGDDRDQWQRYDSCHLIGEATQHLPMLVDHGDSDEFLAEQLKPELLRTACDKANYPATLRMQPGYDHSYFFIASFIEEHLAFHAKHL